MQKLETPIWRPASEKEPDFQMGILKTSVRRTQPFPVMLSVVVGLTDEEGLESVINNMQIFSSVNIRASYMVWGAVFVPVTTLQRTRQGT